MRKSNSYGYANAPNLTEFKRTLLFTLIENYFYDIQKRKFEKNNLFVIFQVKTHLEVIRFRVTILSPFYYILYGYAY